MLKVSLHLIVFCSVAVLGNLTLGQEKDFNAYPNDVAKYLRRLYGEDIRPLAFRDDYPSGFEKWQSDARAASSPQAANGHDCVVGR